MSDAQALEIVLVDDDEGHIELVRRNLRRAGVSNGIRALTSGTQALDYVFCRGEFAARSNNGHLLLLLDIKMPGGVDGTEVLRQIKADTVKRKIPVIMLTTTDDPREIERCYELGCSVYISKPIDPGEFVEAVRRLGLFISVVSLPHENGATPA